MRLLSIFIVLLFSIQLSFCQTSNKQKGCIPLTVNFDADQASSYYWSFDDGASSTMKSPEHIFTDAGEYVVRLYTNASQSNLVGQIEITVFPDLIVDITSNITTGCNPSTVNFESVITKDDAIDIEKYLWTFGDGNSSVNRMPSYTYRSTGTFDVSVALTTNYSNCNKTIIKEEYMTIDEPVASFSTNTNFSCDNPATFSIDNTTDMEIGYTYLWDFDNGTTSTAFNPGNIVYNQNGDYIIKLTVTAPNGCQDLHVQRVSVGKPLIEFDLEDTTCIDVLLQVDNNTFGITHEWSFGQDAFPTNSSSSSPVWSYRTPGVKTVYYETGFGTCSADTTFQILVSEKLSEFTVIPESICSDPAYVLLEARYKGLDKYYWNGSTDSEGPTYKYEFDNPQRDSFYINELETLNLSLGVETESGCIDATIDSFDLQLPEAFFIPDSIIGLAPLTITFSDHSKSSEPIVSRHWNFDDGQKVELGPDDLEIVHTFTEPGRYFVKLGIENEVGCFDNSKGTWIEAIDFELVNSGEGSGGGRCEGGEMGQNGCISNRFNWTINGPSQLDYHVNWDDGRFDHCWKENSGTYFPKFPGVFPGSVFLEYKGFLLQTEEIQDLNVRLPRAKIEFENSCDKIYEVSFKSSSENYEKLVWKTDDQIIGSSESFTHTFNKKGKHQVILEAHGADNICDPSIDTVDIYITSPIAKIKVEDKLCDNEFYELDASESQDVYLSCGNNILWEFESQRPRAVSREKISHRFIAGKQNVRLTVTDINGCTDRDVKIIEVFGNNIEFAWDTSICFPNNALLTNTTLSDTTIATWAWSFDSDEKSPRYTFEAKDLHPTKEDTVAVSLMIEDVLGCRDTLEKFAYVYEPFSKISLARDKICVGSEIEVRANDFTEEGSQLTYNWDFGIAGNGTLRKELVSFSERGSHTIKLDFEEVGSGCGGSLEAEVDVFNIPIADFESSVDDLDIICYPHTVEFENNSTVDGPVTYSWSFGGGASSALEDPAITFDKGEFTIDMTVKSRYGCEDTQAQKIELVGPSGNLFADDKTLCLGQEIELELRNPDDVSTYSWDFGDGTVIKDQNPVKHAYSFLPPGNAVEIDLVIKSDDNGCEIIKSVPVRIQDAIAGFESSVDDQEFVCHPHVIDFTNTSEVVGFPNYNWTFGDGETSSEKSPSKSFGKGSFNVEMIARSSFGCVDSILWSVDVVGPSGNGSLDKTQLCLGDTLELQMFDAEDVDSYYWDLKDGTIVENQSPLKYTYTSVPNDLIVVDLILQNNENGCETKRSYPLKINEVVSEFGVYDGSDYCFGKVSFENLSVGADRFIWNFGDGSINENFEIDYIFDTEGDKSVSLTAIHEESGCSNVFSHVVSATDGKHLFAIPNVFSPNGDGKNDLFGPVIKDVYQDKVEVTDFKVYNRWGKQVNDSGNLNSWDGSSNGEYLAPDVFAYYIELDVKDCTVLGKKGNVTIVK